MAKRKGNDWFVSGITNNKGREMEIPKARPTPSLSFTPAFMPARMPLITKRKQKP